MISSGVCLLRGIVVLHPVRRHASGWTTSVGAAHHRSRASLPSAAAWHRVATPRKPVALGQQEPARPEQRELSALAQVLACDVVAAVPRPVGFEGRINREPVPATGAG